MSGTNLRIAKQSTAGSAVVGGVAAAAGRVPKIKPDGTIDSSFWAGAGPLAAGTTRIYVDGVNGDDTDGLGTAAAPYATLQKAVDENAAAGAPTFAMIVAPGSYVSPAVTDAGQTVISIFGAGQDVTELTGTLSISNAYGTNRIALHDCTADTVSDLYASSNPVIDLVNTQLVAALSANGSSTGVVRLHPGGTAPALTNLALERQAITDANLLSFLQRETFTLGAPDIANKYVTLAATPANATSVSMIVAGSGAVLYGPDYVLSGANVDWTGLTLDGVLIAGDVLQVSYLVL